METALYETMYDRFNNLYGRNRANLVKIALDLHADTRPAYSHRQAILSILATEYSRADVLEFVRAQRLAIKAQLMAHYPLKHTRYIAPGTFPFPSRALWNYQEVDDDLGNQVEPHYWIICNAPRPIYGHALAQGDFITGVFYAAVDPANERSEWMLKENAALDATRLIYIDQVAWDALLEAYRQELILKYGDAVNALTAETLGNQLIDRMNYPEESEVL